MNSKLFGLAAMFCGIVLAWQSASADGILPRHHHAPPTCEPGFKIVEEVVMQEVTRTVCKMVPDMKKKWVYSWIDDPFCVKCGKHGSCQHCQGPYCRKQLVKFQIDDCPTMKCVTETITEVVPVKVYRKVPCDDAPKGELLPVRPTPIGNK